MRDELFAELEESVRQMKQIQKGDLKGKVTTAEDLGVVDVAALRERFHLSQAKFAALLGISLRTLQGWEQGRRQPKGAEQTLLKVAAKSPEILLALSA